MVFVIAPVLHKTVSLLLPALSSIIPPEHIDVSGPKLIVGRGLIYTSIESITSQLSPLDALT